MKPHSYSIFQCFLHWAVALLVIFNLLFPDAMNAWHRMIRHGQTPTAADVSSANFHAYFGIAIILLAIIRLVLRWRTGVPAEPAGQPLALHLIAKIVHLLLYALMYLMPVSRIAAYYFGIDVAGSIHADILKAMLWAVIAAHALGALVQHFYFRTNVLRRMTVG
ncbi:cytochrome b [Agrobacterium sp. DKPNP3]|uniref:cytochrome b n=1 Tax=Agrobacterium sp. DKPNP3 TaxID=3457323 RepID=UPI00404509CB